ncbi:MAG TPA: hypothetical protein VHK88_03635, partial [Aquihabitans sp.]|nr:hypothetical protein [Aquihabitans sp.]
ASEDPAALDCPAESVWDDARAEGAPEPATDDHPFPYLRERSIPSLYLWTAAAMLAFSIVAVRLVGGSFGGVSRYADLLAMGVAFLMLETKGVVGFALLFGTTWLVNALVFMGVLLSVLVAVAISKRVSFKRPTRLYAFLLASLVVAYVVPPADLLDLHVVPRFFAAVVVAFTPIFIANLVFTQRFRDTSHSTTAFGANLIGAMAGGLMEYLSLITGYRNLLIVVAIAYAVAFFLGRDALQKTAAA